jgi:hypothetical protein
MPIIYTPIRYRTSSPSPNPEDPEDGIPCFLYRIGPGDGSKLYTIATYTLSFRPACYCIDRACTETGRLLREWAVHTMHKGSNSRKSKASLPECRNCRSDFESLPNTNHPCWKELLISPMQGKHKLTRSAESEVLLNTYISRGSVGARLEGPSVLSPDENPYTTP